LFCSSGAPFGYWLLVIGYWKRQAQRLGSAASGLLRKLLNWMKTMDFALWLGANRSHSRSYGEDEQQSHGAKGAFSCSVICEAEH